MCAYFQQKESIPVLINFLKTPDHDLRAEAIKALGELKAENTEDILIDMYNNQPDKCQNEIIRSIGEFSTGRSIDFLHHAFENTTNIETRKVAAEAIYNYGDIGKELFEALEQGSEPESTQVLEHIANPLIKFK
jgi:HEAT repeat protein